MKVLIAYPFKSAIRHRNQVIYLPELVQDEFGLRAAIREYHPHVIIVGNNAVGCETLELWRFVLGNIIHLTLIRRGSSLSRIDIIRARHLNINVLNTLSVNSRFVAEYMIEHLHLPTNGNCSTIAIIGSGAIGKRIAYRLHRAKHKVYIYSPSLATTDITVRNRILKLKGIAESDIQVTMTPEDAVTHATHVIIAVDADRVTRDDQKLSRRFFEIIPDGARIVSVTEFRVFANEALEVIIERVRQGKISVRLDSPPFDLRMIRNPPVQLEAVSVAMTVPGCGEALDQAALVVLASVALEQSFQSSLKFIVDSTRQHEEITIVGAGIMGLLTAFFLSESGYRVTIIDEHDSLDLHIKYNQRKTSSRGTTLDGCDARHASITETMPHAVFYRIDSLRKTPYVDGGWKIIRDEYNAQELAWIDRFSELAGYPEFVGYLLNRFVSNLNRRGIELWDEISRTYPHIIQDTIRNRRLIKIYSSTSNDNVLTFQRNYHKPEDDLSQLTRTQVLERLPSIRLKDGDAGAIEVPGLVINHLKLCQNMITYLKQRVNVTFKWGTKVCSINDISSSKIIFASSLNRLDSPVLDDVSLAIQGVLGCWTKVPNVHSIRHGFKINERDPINTINVTPSYDGQYLYVTGGYGFCGQRGIVQSKSLNELTDLFHSTIRSYLPDEVEASESEVSPKRYCIRQMTPDGMPIISQLSTKNKNQQVYFVGGTNSGGFVQSPILAEILLYLIQGSPSSTHLGHVYRSLRLDRNSLLFN